MDPLIVSAISNSKILTKNDSAEIEQLVTLSKSNYFNQDLEAIAAELHNKVNLIRVYYDKENKINAFIVLNISSGIGIIIKMVWVAEKLRRNKIGSFIIKDTIEKFPDKTYVSIIYAEIARNNLQSISFFSSLGFSPIGFLQMQSKQINNLIVMSHIENQKLQPQKEYVEFINQLRSDHKTKPS